MSSLLNVLMNSVLSKESTEALATKTNLDSKQVEGVVQNALPVIMQSMLNNANDEKGAAGLSKALGAHAAAEGSVAEQIAGADTKDGAKILSHLLGGNSDSVVDKIASSMSLSSPQVGTILSSLAPVILSMIGKETKSSGSDAGGLGGMLTGLLTGKSGADDGKSDLFGSILGMATKGGGDKDMLSSLMGLISGK